MTYSASGPTPPTVDPGSFAGPILSNMMGQLSPLLPYAAAFLVVWLGLNFIQTWLGHTSAAKWIDRQGALSRGPSHYSGRGKNRRVYYTGRSGRIYDSSDF